MNSATNLLNDLNFRKTFTVNGRSSIADLFKPKKRCGIYVLHFTSGEYYVGQAVDVTRRYVQHTKNHDDIERISFKEVPKDKLNDIEREAISEFETNGFLLRNISLTSIPKGESDFDLIMDSSQQERWLSNPNFVDIEGRRIQDEDLRRKYHRRFQIFEQKPYAQEVISVLQEYIQAGIPAIKRGEISFWSCTCLPGTKKLDPDIKEICARVNVGWQEVFVIYYKSNGEIGYAWQVAKSPLRAKLKNPLQRIKWRKLDFIDFVYPSGGPDQIRLEITGADVAKTVIQDKEIQKAIRLLNLRLVRKAPCIFGRYHCLDLADKLLEFE
jgi:hypothetical protein